MRAFHQPGSIALRLGVVCTFVCTGAGTGAHAGESPPFDPPPPAGIDYRIAVSLDPDTRALHGKEEIVWTNPSRVPIARVPVHLYLNAFENEASTFMRSGSPRDGAVKEILPVHHDPWGFIDLKSVRQVVASGTRVVVMARPISPDDGNPFDRSLVELSLAEPVLPGERLSLSIEFEARLPIPIARTGGEREFFMVGQWYPKIGAFEWKGESDLDNPHFAARQFRSLTEFFADFANYDVRIEVPSNFVIGATGEGRPDTAMAGRKAVLYSAKAVHDFAFACGSQLVDEVASHTPPGGTPIAIHVLVPTGTESQIPRWRAITERTLDVLAARVGPFPYPTFTVVMPPTWAAPVMGMEYPTLVTGAPGDLIWDLSILRDLRVAELVIAHEIAHNYFYGLLASNEQEEAFLDEGFTQYWEHAILESAYGERAPGGTLFGRGLDLTDQERENIAHREDAFREPVAKRPAGYFRPGTEGMQVYTRPALSFITAERLFGRDALDRVFHAYFRAMRFRHPRLADFLAAAKEGGGDEVAAFFAEAFTRDRIPDYAVRDLTVEAWEPALGRFVTDGGVTWIGEDDRRSHRDSGIAADQREDDGSILMEVTDGGFLRGTDGQTGNGGRREGGVSRVPMKPTNAPDKAAPGRFQDSRVRLDGPGWDHLPVDVELRFDDGAVIVDHWDGRSAWRAYRFVRRAALSEVRIDPADLIALDPTPENNSRSRKPERAFAADWSVYLAGACSWLQAGLALWL